MSSTGHRTDRDHPISVAVSAIEEVLTRVEHAPAWSLSEEETRRDLLALTRLSARVDALQLKVAAHADRARVGDASGATSAAVWWASQTRMTQRDAARKMKLAKALEGQDVEPVGAALAKGEVLMEQAQAITDAVTALPDDLDPDLKSQARDHLIEQAKHFDARALSIQGRRILDVVAPEVGEAEEAKKLVKEERDAEANAKVTMHSDGSGRTWVGS